MSTSNRTPRRERRLVGVLSGAMALACAATIVASASSAAVAAPVTITQFPVQGLCTYFPDSFGLPRGGGRVHEGVDIMPRSGKAGDRVYAVADGTLTRQFLAAGEPLAGNGWKLQLPDGTYFYYFHLGEFAPGLAEGSKVVTGQIIGRVGQTGNAGGPHLHFELHPQGGAAVDPYPMLHAVDGCSTTAVPPQPAATSGPDLQPALQPAIRMSMLGR